jgi:hypothetical protein
VQQISGQKNHEPEKERAGEYSKEVMVDRNLVGIIIGKGGSNIHEMMKRFGVLI